MTFYRQESRDQIRLLRLAKHTQKTICRISAQKDSCYALTAALLVVRTVLHFDFVFVDARENEVSEDQNFLFPYFSS